MLKQKYIQEECSSIQGWYILKPFEGCSWYFEIGFVEGKAIYPYKSLNATIRQNLVRRGSCHPRGSLPPHFSGHSWRNGFASNPSSSVPGSLEVPLLGVGGGENICWEPPSQKLFRSPVWQIFVLTHCGCFHVTGNPATREIKWGWSLSAWALKSERQGLQIQLPAFVILDRDLPTWASDSLSVEWTSQYSLYPRAVWVNPQ